MRKTPAHHRVVERAALLAAQAAFLKWRQDWGSVPRVDRRAFNELHAAVKRLRSALLPFDPALLFEADLLSTSQEAANLDRLLLHMQDKQGCVQPREDYRDYLSGLIELLDLLEAAAEAGGGKGAHRAHDVYVWIWIAADQWAATLKKQPSAAERGRFWLALQDLQDDQEARDRRLPTIGTRDVLRRALQERKSRQQMLQQLPT